jgi:hypothetical protein
LPPKRLTLEDSLQHRAEALEGKATVILIEARLIVDVAEVLAGLVELVIPVVVAEVAVAALLVVEIVVALEDLMHRNGLPSAA